MNIDLTKFHFAVVGETLQLRDAQFEQNIALRLHTISYFRETKNKARVEREVYKIQNDLEKAGVDFGRILNASLL